MTSKMPTVKLIANINTNVIYFVNLAGRYIIELRVGNNLGQKLLTACGSAAVMKAIQGKDLR